MFEKARKYFKANQILYDIEVVDDESNSMTIAVEKHNLEPFDLILVIGADSYLHFLIENWFKDKDLNKKPLPVHYLSE